MGTDERWSLFIVDVRIQDGVVFQYKNIKKKLIYLNYNVHVICFHGETDFRILLVN